MTEYAISNKYVMMYDVRNVLNSGKKKHKYKNQLLCKSLMLNMCGLMHLI